jgi:hypothetical protein
MEIILKFELIEVEVLETELFDLQDWLLNLTNERIRSISERICTLAVTHAISVGKPVPQSRTELLSFAFAEGIVKTLKTLKAEGDAAQAAAPTPQKVVHPVSVTMRQARLALLQLKLLSAVTAFIQQIPDPGLREAVAIEWEFSNEVRRDSVLLGTFAKANNLSEEDVDNLFKLAASL